MRFLELKIPPVIVFGLIGFFMWWIRSEATPFNVELPRLLSYFVFIAAGVAGMLGIIPFIQAKTSFNPHSPQNASALVVVGIYRFTRNPMYLSLLLLLLCWSIYLQNVLTIIGLPMFFFYMNRFQILPEERILESKFGVAYIDYKRRVRRWI